MSPEKIEENGGVENALIKELTLRGIDHVTNHNFSRFLGKPSAGTHELPYLAKMFLLAAFVCQHNKQTVDRQLFDPSRNGKRRARRKGAADNDGGGGGSGDDAGDLRLVFRLSISHHQRHGCSA